MKYLDLLEDIITKTKKEAITQRLNRKNKKRAKQRRSKFLLAILESKGINVADKVPVTEIKIAELF